MEALVYASNLDCQSELVNGNFGHYLFLIKSGHIHSYYFAFLLLYKPVDRMVSSRLQMLAYSRQLGGGTVLNGPLAA